VVIARTERNQRDAREENRPRPRGDFRFVTYAECETERADEQERKVRRDVEEVRDAERRARIGEPVVGGILRNRRKRQQYQQRREERDEQRGYAPALQHQAARGLSPGSPRCAGARPLGPRILRARR
jgi:hypothetical protein